METLPQTLQICHAASCRDDVLGKGKGKGGGGCMDTSPKNKDRGNLAMQTWLRHFCLIPNCLIDPQFFPNCLIDYYLTTHLSFTI